MTMWTRCTRPSFAALAALALCACGGESEPAAPAAADAPSQTVFGGDRPAPQGEAAPADATGPATRGASGGWPVSTVAFDDSTPEAALATYLNRLAAGDLPGAIEVCDPTAPGTAELRKRADGATSAAASGMDLSVIAELLTEGIASATTSETARTDDQATFAVTIPEKPARECVVVRTPDGWRVQPPPSGLPNA